MPIMPKRQCQCGAIVSGDCPECKAKYKQQYDKDRGSSTQRGYDRKWGKARRVYLTKNPLCIDCKAKGITRAANVVHHIIPLDQGGAKYSSNNLMALCRECHEAKHKRF